MPQDKPLMIATAVALPVSDLRASIDWYVEKLGFNRPGEGVDEFGFAVLEREGAAIMLKQADTARAGNRTATPGLDLFDAYIWVSDIATVDAEFEQRAVHKVEGPVERLYGCTEIAVHDPDGYRIVFGDCP